MGHCLVIYDIPNDRVRTRVADICQDYGLDRIQYSAFLGRLVRAHQEELMLKLAQQLGGHAGSIHLYPICDKDWRRRQVVEREESRVPVLRGKGGGPRRSPSPVRVGSASGGKGEEEEDLDALVPI